jgi:predicted DNA-binding transcriptional regulator AlpA
VLTKQQALKQLANLALGLVNPRVGRALFFASDPYSMEDALLRTKSTPTDLSVAGSDPTVDEPTNPDIQTIIRPVGRTSDVLDALNCGRTKLYDLMKNDPTFPRPWNMGRELRFFMDRIEDWKAAQPRRQYRAGHDAA